MTRYERTPEQKARNREWTPQYNEDHRDEISAKRHAAPKRPYLRTPEQAARHVEEQKDYRARHRQELRVKASDYAATHKDDLRAYRSANKGRYKHDPARSHEYYVAHIEDYRRRAREWDRDNPLKARASRHRRRESLRGAGPYVRMDPWPTDCQICQAPITGAFHVDHEPPLAWVSKHPEYEGLFVLRPTHPKCNRVKFIRPDWEYKKCG